MSIHHDDILLGFEETKELIGSGSIHYGTGSAIVAPGWGVLYDRNMMDGGYMRKHEFTVEALTTDISTWNLKPKTEIGCITAFASGSYLIQSIVNEASVTTVIRLQENT